MRRQLWTLPLGLLLVALLLVGPAWGQPTDEVGTVPATGVDAAPAPAAQETPPPPATGRSILFQLYDPDKRISAAPTVRLTGPEGVEVSAAPLDDGTMPDIQAGDDIWSTPLMGAPTGQLDVHITSGERTWTGTATVAADDARPRIFLRLEDGRAVVGDPNAVAGRNPGSAPPPESGAPRGVSKVAVEGSTVDLKPGSALLVVGWLMACLGGGLALATVARRPARPARLAHPAPTGVAPLRLARGALDGVFEGVLAGHRVIVVGPGPAHACAVPLVEQGALPADVVAAVEALAVTAGMPVALLVTEPALLDREGPRDVVVDLARRVGGRFPLVVVDGPLAWAEAGLS